jgi:hypothetical protein
MENYLKMLNDFTELDMEIDSVRLYYLLRLYCNQYLTDDYQPDSGYIRKIIQQVFNAEESDEVKRLFSKYTIENGFHKFLIADTIIEILIVEKLFLRELPELEAFIENNPADTWVDYDEKDIYLENARNLLQSFDDRDIELIRRHIDLIVESAMEDVE